MRPYFLLGWLFLVSITHASGANDNAWPSAIRTDVLSEEKPLYLPLNSRVTTTVRFPVPLEQDPVGTGFWVERDGNNQAPAASVEYILAWDQSDTRLDIQARSNASLRNLNISLGGKTYVIVCFPAARPLDASAAVNLKFAEVGAKNTSQTPPKVDSDGHRAQPNIRRTEDPPESAYEASSPARWIGMLDRLHLLHGAAPADLEALVRTMPKVSVSFTAIEQEFGPFTSTLIRAVRDDRIDLIGFIILLKNTSPQPILFDQTGCAARAGSVFLPQLTSEMPARLEPGEVSPAYFVVEGGGRSNAPLKASNDWRLSFQFSQPPAAVPTPVPEPVKAPSETTSESKQEEP